MTIDELNEQVLGGEFDEFVRVCEARQCKEIAAIADTICAKRGIRLVLLAGCSSAGKTTTAKRLCTQLRVNGVYALHLSTDDYFKGDPYYPKNPDGSLDYEHVDCVDRVKLAADLNALLEGRTIVAHRFDFIKKEPYEDISFARRLPGNGVIVLEGIHSLNPLLTELVPEEVKYRIFVEPTSKLEVFAFTRLKSAENRFYRRMVRDNQFRKTHPTETLRIWPFVREGEKKWIEPFRSRADVEFDSSLDYEMAVLKPYILGLLEMVRLRQPENFPIIYSCEFFRLIESASPNAVPGDSILRETIGGSQLVY